MSIISLIIYLVGFAIAFAVNRHALSPTKLFLALLAFFSLDLFQEDYPLYIHAVFVGYVVIAVACLPFESPRIQRFISRKAAMNEEDAKVAVFVIWVLTLVPVAAQLYLIYNSGGVQNYIYSSSSRVQLYKGLGHILAMRDSIRVLSLFYWCVFLAANLRRKQLALFVAHFGITLAVTLATASRGSVLWPLVYMVIGYDILKRRVPKKTIIIVIAIVVPAVSILSAVRNNITRDSAGDVSLKKSTSHSIMETSYSADALLPLTLVLPDDNINYKYGLTFLTVITNFVPRDLWPGKPDSGGVVITKEYLGDAWGGESYISTGIIAESALNFGRFLGIIVGYLILYLSLRAICKEYHRLRFTPIPVNMTVFHIARVTFYAGAMETIAAAHVIEFTNAVWTLAVNGMFAFGAAKVIQMYAQTRLRRVKRSPRSLMPVQYTHAGR